MGLSSFFSDIESYFIDFDSMSDYEIGEYYIKKYVLAYNQKYKKTLTLDSFVTLSAGTLAKGQTFLDGFGFAIRASQANDAQITESFELLLENFIANAPPPNSFFSYLSQVTTQTSAAGEKVVSIYDQTKDAVSSAATGVKNVLSNTVNSLDFITKYLPIILIALALVFVFRKSK